MNGKAKIKPEILEELPTIGETGLCGLQGKDGVRKGTQDTAQHRQNIPGHPRSVKPVGRTNGDVGSVHWYG